MEGGIPLAPLLPTTAEPTALTVDSSGDIYLTANGVSGVRDPAGTTQIREFDTGTTTVSAIALAPSGDVVVIDSRPTALNPNPNVHGIVYSPLGVELNETFGEIELVNEAGIFNVPGGMAYDDTRNELYVVDGPMVRGAGTILEAGVAVFKGPSVFATAKTGAPFEVEAESVTLTGEVNPEGLDATASFEYGSCATPSTCSTSAYGSTVPAVQAAGGLDPGSSDLGKGTAPVPVQAHVTSAIQPNKTYHYRLVGHNENGDSPARNEATFTTPRVAPTVEIQAVSGVRFDAVDLAGTVNPENTPTTYRFLYGPCQTPTKCAASPYPSSSPPQTTTQYGQTSTEPEISELSPATTYHYRLIAVNEQNETAESFEGKFTTTTAPLPTVTTLLATAVTQTTATLTGTVAPNGLTVTYGFQLGTKQATTDPRSDSRTSPPVSSARPSRSHCKTSNQTPSTTTASSRATSTKQSTAPTKPSPHLATQAPTGAPHGTPAGRPTDPVPPCRHHHRRSRPRN